VVEQPLDRLGDLKLAPPGRLEVGDRLVDGRREEVDADKGEVALGLLGLLHQVLDPAGLV
jgi:hypothetical protein